jgi:hypothetical protein
MNKRFTIMVPATTFLHYKVEAESLDEARARVNEMLTGGIEPDGETFEGHDTADFAPYVEHKENA